MPMQYREAGNTGCRLSVLGLGCMRFRRRGPVIDQAAAEAVMEAALEEGIDYLDTAYAYPGNEECIGRFIAKGNRDRFLLATKLPHYQCTSSADFDRILDEELRRLQTDHIDFYLIHMLTSLSSWQRVVEMGIEDWIARRRADGSIRHIGFSFHGGADDFRQVVDAYPWEFCQIQLNYQDAHAQAGLDGLHYAAERGLPVIIMEPLRGGRLAGGLPHGARAVLEQAEPQQSPAAWGLQWLYNLPEVTCVLSGMDEVEQVRENAALASRVVAGSLDESQLAVYDRVLAELRRVEKVGCTGCGYCMPCPHGVDIPGCFRSLNIRASEGYLAGLSDYIMNTSLKARPSNASLCVGCRRCERRCPQHIAIHTELAQVAHELEGVPYRLAVRFKGVRYKV